MAGRLSFVGMKLDNVTLIYLLLSGVESEQAEWIRDKRENAVKRFEPPCFETVTAQLLQKELVEKSEDMSIEFGSDG